MWNVPDWEWKIISPIQELSTGRNTWAWIPLSLFLPCAKEQKRKKWLKDFPSPKHYHNKISILGVGVGGQVSAVCPQGKVFSSQTASLQYFLSNYVLLKTTTESGVKCCYGFSIQCSSQELGLCLSSINHFMVTGGGPRVSQSPPAGWPQGGRLPSSMNPNKKRVQQDDVIKAGVKPALSSYSIYTISIIEYRQK